MSSFSRVLERTALDFRTLPICNSPRLIHRQREFGADSTCSDIYGEPDLSATPNMWMLADGMDDILVLSRTRWGLRRAVRVVNGFFRELDLSQHPDKTFIRRIDRGLEFLGYHFSRDTDGVQAFGLAAVTVAKFKEKLFRLYEQARRTTASARSGRPRGTEPSTSDSIATRINNYERRWLAWARGD